MEESDKLLPDKCHYLEGNIYVSDNVIYKKYVGNVNLFPGYIFPQFFSIYFLQIYLTDRAHSIINMKSDVHG